MDEPPQLHFTAAPLLCKTLATQEPEGRRSHRKMKVIAAYLLAVLGGNTCPSAEDLKDILGSVGAEADDDRIELLLAEVKGKDITELIASGREKLASVPSGGGAAVAVAAPGGGGGAAPAAAEPKKEEKVEEKEESDDVRLLLLLFLNSNFLFLVK
ncbi:hypothetical protein PVL29_008171 [Vitis rotundifolia]|uniref:60S acidic ribosomal protein P2 n=1 Tax=Vitis rotundifolia TaxID=103349 RepID=A0AA39A1Z4_VITRO|nr:hypothetical protein PVL29_008171 [Vitis rotundifolia]